MSMGPLETYRSWDWFVELSFSLIPHYWPDIAICGSVPEETADLMGRQEDAETGQDCF